MEVMPKEWNNVNWMPGTVFRMKEFCSGGNQNIFINEAAKTGVKTVKMRGE
jgi:hypothetical protein